MAPAAILVGMLVAGGAVKAVGGVLEANANAEAAEINAKQAEENAELTLEAYRQEETQSRFQSRQTLGNIRTAYAANGVRMDGTPKDYLEQNAAIAETTALNIRNKGYLEAKSYRDQAAGLRKQAGGYRTGGVLGAIGSGLSTGAGIMKRV